MGDTMNETECTAPGCQSGRVIARVTRYRLSDTFGPPAEFDACPESLEDALLHLSVQQAFGMTVTTAQVLVDGLRQRGIGERIGWTLEALE